MNIALREISPSTQDAAIVNPDQTYRVCDQCGTWVETNELLFRLRVEIAAETGPVEIPPQGQIGDVREELEKLMHRLESMTDEQVTEATAQVFESFDFSLCAKCRQEIRLQLRKRFSLFDKPPHDHDAPRP